MLLLSSVPRKKLYAVLFALAAFMFSLVLYPFYSSGDQTQYRVFYDSVSNMGLIEAFIYYRGALDSQEPGYFLLSYMFSGLLPKDVLFSALNGFLVYFLYLQLMNKSTSIIVLLLLSTNFYLMVLFFSAERLKLALTLLVAANYYRGVSRFSLTLVAISSHITVVVLAAAKFMLYLKKVLQRLFTGIILKRELLTLIALALISSIFIALLFDHLSHKFVAYNSQEESPLIAVIKTSIFVLTAILYSKDRIEPVIAGIPILIAAYFFGSDRMVIFSYFLFMFYAVEVRGGLNFWTVISSFYFSAKGLIFIYQFVNYGDGFR